jgi:hypothetical protein
LLTHLIEERFDHLDSEPAFSNYIGRLKAEKRYLEDEAMPDWRHKADYQHQESDLAVCFADEAGTETNIQNWWTVLYNTATKWFVTEVRHHICFTVVSWPS